MVGVGLELVPLNFYEKFGMGPNLGLCLYKNLDETHIVNTVWV